MKRALHLALLLCACNKVQIVVQARPSSNQDRPVYVVVREVEAKTFEQEGYDAIAALVARGDDSLRWVEQIAPGQERRQCVARGRKGMGVYILYTNPPKLWQSWREQPGRRWLVPVE